MNATISPLLRPVSGTRTTRLRGIALSLLLGLPAVASAENWPQWRGPSGNGSTSETGLPDSCDPALAKWSIALPGSGNATPAVWNDRVFITSEDPASKGLLALCVNAGDGSIRWQQRLGDVINAPRNNGATPSPVTDGERVGFLFGSGDLAVLDADGKVLWRKNLVADYGNFATKFGYSSSPLLWDGKLYIQILRRPKPYSGPAGMDEPLESLLLSLDLLTGKELWKLVRKSDAVGESFESYATPVALDGGARKELLIQGGDTLSGHDPATGAELWSFNYNPKRESLWRLVASPVTVDGLIVATTPRGGPLMALKTGATGMLDTGALVWTYEERTTDSGTPLIYQGLIYVLQSDKSNAWSGVSKHPPGIYLLVVDPATGKECGRCQIAPGGTWRSSPTGADGKIYLMSEDGEVVVVSAGTDGKILSRFDYGGKSSCATIAIANGGIFIRTDSKLTCISKRP